MAEIATFRCSNYRCRLTLRMCKDFPVWHPDTPPTVRTTVSPVDADRNFIVRYRTELYCRECRLLLADPADSNCPRCSSSELHSDQAGLPCVQCTEGTFAMVHLVVR